MRVAAPGFKAIPVRPHASTTYGFAHHLGGRPLHETTDTSFEPSGGSGALGPWNPITLATPNTESDYEIGEI